jgi:RHS repeat-associated protein
MPVSLDTQHFGSINPVFSRKLLLAVDQQRSILAGLDCNGLNHLAYDAYGSRSGPLAASTHLGFNGQLKEYMGGWYYLGNGHRIYNPVLMRFHSPDRLSPFDKGGVNAYAYCEGDPVNFADPTGQFMSAVFKFVTSFGGITEYLDNIATTLYRSRPRGVLGYASVASNVGYAGVATGTAMQAAGYPAGAAVSHAGSVLASAGNGVRAAHNAVRVLKGTRLGKAMVQRIAMGKTSNEALNAVVESRRFPSKALIRIQMPPVSNRKVAAKQIRQK